MSLVQEHTRQQVGRFLFDRASEFINEHSKEFIPRKLRRKAARQIAKRTIRNLKDELSRGANKVGSGSPGGDAPGSEADVVGEVCGAGVAEGQGSGGQVHNPDGSDSVQEGEGG